MSIQTKDHSRSYTARSVPYDQIFDPYSNVPDPLAVLAFLDLSQTTNGTVMGY